MTCHRWVACKSHKYAGDLLIAQAYGSVLLAAWNLTISSERFQTLELVVFALPEPKRSGQEAYKLLGTHVKSFDDHHGEATAPGMREGSS